MKNILLKVRFLLLVLLVVIYEEQFPHLRRKCTSFQSYMRKKFLICMSVHQISFRVNFPFCFLAAKNACKPKTWLTKRKLQRWLTVLTRHTLCFLQGVPPSPPPPKKKLLHKTNNISVHATVKEQNEKDKKDEFLLMFELAPPPPPSYYKTSISYTERRRTKKQEADFIAVFPDGEWGLKLGFPISSKKIFSQKRKQ